MAAEPATTGRLQAAASARRAAIVALARRLVRIPSDLPAHDERAVVDALRRAAASLGLPGGTVIAARAERPNLLIAIDGPAPGPSILLNGHVDTKPPGDLAAWATDPWAPRLAGGELHGLGAADMKGALAAMLHAAAILRAEGLPARGRLLLAFTADEEADGVLGLSVLLDRLPRLPDAALVGEPSGIERSFDTLPVGSRGFVGFRLVASGQRIHSGLSDRLSGRTAVAALARAIDRLPDLVELGRPPEGSPSDERATLAVATSLEAGVGPGIVPDIAVARGEVRTVPGQTRSEVLAALAAALDRARAEAGGDLDVRIEPDPEDWPGTSIDPSLPVVAALSSATEGVTGQAPRLGLFPGATEAHALAERGIPAVPAFGPGLLRLAHVPSESIRVDDLVAATAIYAVAVADLLR